MNLRPEDLFEGAILQHYKGKLYRFLYFAKMTENVQEVVVYQALYENRGVWVREREEFFGHVPFEGNKIPRFKLADEQYYVIIDPELVSLLEDSDLFMKDIIATTKEECQILFTPMPNADSENTDKELTTMLVVGSAIGLSIVIKSLTSLIRTIQRKPQVLIYDTLEPIVEEGKILKNSSGVPVWRVKKEHKIIEFNEKPETTEMEFATKAKGFILKYKSKL